jgi:leucine-zipper of insertion element IS481
MSKACLVITLVVLEGRSQSEVPAPTGSLTRIFRLVARYRTEGETAFEPRSRRPKRSPAATSPDVVDLVLRLRKQLTEHGVDARSAHHLLAPHPAPPDHRVDSDVS